VIVNDLSLSLVTISSSDISTELRAEISSQVIIKIRQKKYKKLSLDYWRWKSKLKRGRPKILPELFGIRKNPQFPSTRIAIHGGSGRFNGLLLR